MNVKISIPGELCDLNTYIDALNNNRYQGNDIKQTETDRVAWQCKGKGTANNVHICFNWFCKDKRKDKDNVCFAKKFILDGLVKAGVLPNDGWNNIRSFTDEFGIDKDNPRVEIEISEVEE